jgi:PAS domain S-box-containing protein
MKDDGLTREELLDQLVGMRRRVSELEAALSRSDQTETTCVVDSHLFHMFFENAPVGYQCLDAHRRIMKVNREWTSLFGYSAQEAAGTLFDDYLVDGQSLAVRERLEMTRAEERTRGLELDIVRKDGSAATVALECTRVRDEQTGSRIVLCILRDVTEKRRVEKAITRAKREWEHTFDAVPDLVAILDEGFRIVRLNKPMADRLGMDVRDAVGKVCHEVIHGTDAPPCECPHRKMWEDGREHACEMYEPRLGGTFMVSASPIYDEHGKLMGTVHVARDVTERKLAEEALKKAHDELEMRVKERTAELAEANELLQEKIRTIDQLYEHVVLSGKAKAIADHTAEVAHELRQPLAIIGGFSRRIARKNLFSDATDEESREDFSHIIREVERLERILDRLIDFNRRESVGLECASPNELIEHVLEVNALRLQEKGVRLAPDLSENVGEIMLDPDRFQHVIRNLVANAIEASPPSGEVYVGTGLSRPSEKARETGHLAADTYFVMTIRNQGAVIPQEELDQVFNPFFTTKDYGTGLGLTLSKKIVEDHKGSISVKSDEFGTVFTVWLPVKGSRGCEAD